MVKYVAGGSGGGGGLTPAQIVANATVQAAFEAKVDRTGAVAGQVPVLQSGGGLAFASVSGSGTVPSATSTVRCTGSIWTRRHHGAGPTPRTPARQCPWAAG